MPAAIEWLSDHGSPYTAGETRRLVRAIGLLSRATPIESPQSNGMAEAFVETAKRGYAQVSPCPDAATVVRQLDAWFEHYNRSKAVGYRSPREFREQLVEKTTENAFGAWRRPLDRPMSAGGGSRPSALVAPS